MKRLWRRCLTIPRSLWWSAGRLMGKSRSGSHPRKRKKPHNECNWNWTTAELDLVLCVVCLFVCLFCFVYEWFNTEPKDSLNLFWFFWPLSLWEIFSERESWKERKKERRKEERKKESCLELQQGEWWGKSQWWYWRWSVAGLVRSFSPRSLCHPLREGRRLSSLARHSWLPRWLTLHQGDQSDSRGEWPHFGFVGKQKKRGVAKKEMKWNEKKRKEKKRKDIRFSVGNVGCMLDYPQE